MPESPNAGRERPIKGLVEESWRLDASKIRSALAQACGASTWIVARRPDGLGEPIRVDLTPRGGNGSVRVDIRYTAGGAVVDDRLLLERSVAGWQFTCDLGDPGCPRRARALFLTSSRHEFMCRRCASLGYQSQRNVLASRVRSIAATLARCEQRLGSADPSHQRDALRDARQIVRKLLAGIKSAPRRASSEHAMST